MAEKSGVDEKAGTEETEHSTGTVEDTSVREEVSEEDNRRILRKTDINLLTAYTIDPTVTNYMDRFTGYKCYAATFGLREDANLHGSSMNAIAQLAWQPFSSYLLVRIKPRYFMPTIVFCWGVAMCGMAASTE
ncbi:hypothetical protein MPER_08957 [Moniliophthora perniciosa FA553]|nr:hypothetical protein MPER_08957 [Moniliophthora perniciosa FA553]